VLHRPSNTDTRPQSTNLRLTAALIAALQVYQKQYGSSDPNLITGFATPPDPSARPGDGPTMTDGNPTVFTAELAGSARNCWWTPSIPFLPAETPNLFIPIATFQQLVSAHLFIPMSNSSMYPPLDANLHQDGFFSWTSERVTL